MNEEQLNELKIRLEEKIKYYNDNYEKYDDEAYNRNYLAYDSYVKVLDNDEQIEFLLYFIKNDGIETKWTYIYLEKSILNLDLNQQRQLVIELYNINKSKSKDGIVCVISKILTNLFVKQKMSLEKTIDLFVIYEQLNIYNLQIILGFFKDKKSEFTLEVYNKIKYFLDDKINQAELEEEIDCVKLFANFIKEILQFSLDFNELFKVTKKIFLADRYQITLNSYLTSLIEIKKNDTDRDEIFNFILENLNYINVDEFSKFTELLTYFTLEQQKQILESIAWGLYQKSYSFRTIDNYSLFLEILQKYTKPDLHMSREFLLLINSMTSELRISKIENAMYHARVYFDYN